MERFFVDTNILVCVYDDAHPSKQAIAMDCVARLWREQSGRISTQVLNELYVNLTRKLPRRLSADQAWDVIEDLAAWQPQPIDREVLSRAREVERRYRLSWWDSLIVAAAQLQNCDVLLTEDLQNGMAFDRVMTRNPFVTQVQEPRASYSVGELPPRHRSRGRPRKSAAG